MPDSPVYRPHQEPLAIGDFRSIPTGTREAETDARAFEYVSRGDFVGGWIELPRSTPAAGAPLALIVHSAGESSTSEALRFTPDWVSRGFAVAAIDLPLHGHRSSPKLSERLFDGLGRLARQESLDADTFALVEEFLRQSTSDLIRAIDSLGTLPEINAESIALVGLGFGSALSAYVLAHDPRPAAAALVGGALRFEDPDLDPARYLETRGTAGACPLLIQAIPGEAQSPLAETEACFERAEGPKQFERITRESKADSDPSRLALDQACDFLAQHLLS